MLKKSQFWIGLIITGILFFFGFGIVGISLFETFFHQTSWRLSSTQARPIGFKQSEDWVIAYRQHINDVIIDMVPFRQQFIQNFRHFEAMMMLGGTTDPQVVPGKNGWLFYDNVFDCDPIGQFKGDKPFSPVEEQQTCKYFQDLNTALARHHIQLIVYVIPSKEVMYPEHMPDYIAGMRVSETSPAEAMVNYVRAHSNVDIHYPKQLLMDAKKNYSLPIYLKYDTHWSRLGGFLTTLQVAQNLGLECDTKGVSMCIQPDRKLTPMDLAKIINIDQTVSDLTEVRIDSFYPNVSAGMDSVLPDYSRHLQPACIRYYRATNPPNQKRILMIRDSFGLSILPFLSKLTPELLANVHLELEPKLVSGFKPDIYFVVITERHMGIVPQKFKKVSDYLNSLPADAIHPGDKK